MLVYNKTSTITLNTLTLSFLIMSKEVMIGMLKVANNGNDLLAILDSLIENEGDNITGEAVDFSGQSVNF